MMDYFEISKLTFCVMIFFDCIGLAFLFFVTLYLINRCFCGLTHKVDRESKTSRIYNKARNSVTNLKTFIRRKSENANANRNKTFETEESFYPKMSKILGNNKGEKEMESKNEKEDFQRMVSIESTSVSEVSSSVSKPSLKQRSLSDCASHEIDQNEATIDQNDPTTITRKSSAKRVSFGINEIPKKLKEFKYRRFHSDSGILENSRVDESGTLFHKIVVCCIF